VRAGFHVIGSGHRYFRNATVFFLFQSFDSSFSGSHATVLNNSQNVSLRDSWAGKRSDCKFVFFPLKKIRSHRHLNTHQLNIDMIILSRIYFSLWQASLISRFVLDNILIIYQNLQQFSPSFLPFSFHWTLTRTLRGCSKLFETWNNYEQGKLKFHNILIR